MAPKKRPKKEDVAAVSVRGRSPQRSTGRGRGRVRARSPPPASVAASSSRTGRTDVSKRRKRGKAPEGHSLDCCM